MKITEKFMGCQILLLQFREALYVKTKLMKYHDKAGSTEVSNGSVLS